MAGKAQFKPGDIVQLKSGGPAMTISSEARGEENHYSVDWFAGSSNKRANYAEASLQPYVEKKK